MPKLVPSIDAVDGGVDLEVEDLQLAVNASVDCEADSLFGQVYNASDEDAIDALHAAGVAGQEALLSSRECFVPWCVNVAVMLR
jgi:hypothetical protein